MHLKSGTPDDPACGVETDIGVVQIISNSFNFHIFKIIISHCKLLLVNLCCFQPLLRPELPLNDLREQYSIKILVVENEITIRLEQRFSTWRSEPPLVLYQIVNSSVLNIAYTCTQLYFRREVARTLYGVEGGREVKKVENPWTGVKSIVPYLISRVVIRISIISSICDILCIHISNKLSQIISLF